MRDALAEKLGEPLNESFWTCAILLLLFIVIAPISALCIWFSGAAWDWPLFGLGWWTGQPVPAWELRWVVTVILLSAGFKTWS